MSETEQIAALREQLSAVQAERDAARTELAEARAQLARYRRCGHVRHGKAARRRTILRLLAACTGRPIRGRRELAWLREQLELVCPDLVLTRPFPHRLAIDSAEGLAWVQSHRISLWTVRNDISNLRQPQSPRATSPKRAA